MSKAPPVDPQGVLDGGRGARDDAVGRRGGQHHVVDLGRRAPGVGQRRSARPRWPGPRSCRRCGARGCRCARRSRLSLVSRLAAMSSLVTILSGRAMPQPVMRMPLTRPAPARPGRDGVDADEAGVAFDDAARVDGQAQPGPADLACPGPARGTAWPARPPAPARWRPGGAPGPTRPPLELTTSPGLSDAGVARLRWPARPPRPRRTRATRGRRSPRPPWRRAARPGRSRRGPTPAASQAASAAWVRRSW